MALHVRGAFVTPWVSAAWARCRRARAGATGKPWLRHRLPPSRLRSRHSGLGICPPGLPIWVTIVLPRTNIQLHDCSKCRGSAKVMRAMRPGRQLSGLLWRTPALHLAVTCGRGQGQRGGEEQQLPTACLLLKHCEGGGQIRLCLGSAWAQHRICHRLRCCRPAACPINA